MATLIPALETLNSSGIPNSERKVLDRLNKLEFPGLEVYFSVPITNRSRKGLFRGETDFVLFHPRHGLLVWEVKGGGVSFENNTWYSCNNHGEHPITDPVKQADKGIGAFIARMEQVMGRSFTMPLGRNLVFPDVTGTQMPLPLGLERDDIIDRDRLNELDQKELERQFARWPRQEALPLNTQDANRFRERILNPRFHLTPTVAEQIETIQSRLVQLTNQQLWALQLLRFVPQLTVTGGAGTGKSILARTKAQELVEEGRRVLFLCYNKGLGAALQTDMAATIAQYPNQISVTTFHDFAQDLIQRSGQPWEPPQEPKDQPAFYEETVPNLLLNALPALDRPYDALIVDEAQDFQPEWWLSVHGALSEEATICLFADPAQDLYQREFELPTDVFEQMVPYPFQLSGNCRNAQEIAQWLCERFEWSEPPAQMLPPSGENVREHRWKELSEQAELSQQAVKDWLERGVKAEDIAVLSPYRPERSKGIAAVAEAFPDKPLRYSTINAFKGLQSPYVLLVDLDTSAFASREDLWYVGATRAIVGLQVLAQTRS